MARPIGVQLGAERDRAAAEVAAEPCGAPHELVGRQAGPGAQILEKRAAQVLLDLVARLLDGDLGQRGDGGEVQVLRCLRGRGGRALEQQDAADHLVARGDRDLDRQAARRMRRAVGDTVADIAPQLGQPLAGRRPLRRDRRGAEPRHDDRDGAADGLGGKLGDALQAVAGQDRIDHPQMQPSQPFDEGGRCGGGGHPRHLSGLPREYASRPGGRWCRLARTQGGRCAAGTSTPEDAARR